MAVSDNDNIARHCGYQKIEPDSGRILATAFSLKKDEDYLSVNWLEFLKKDTFDEAIQELRVVFQNKLDRVGAKSRFAVLNVGRMRTAALQQTGFQLTVMHEPEDNDPSHSGIYGITQENQLVVGEILAECVHRTESAKL